MLRVRIRPVEADQYGLTLAELLSRSGEKRGVEEDFSDPMLVFCGLSQGKLDQLLTAMGRSGLPRIALKAMLTPTNAAGPPSSCGPSCAGSTRPWRPSGGGNKFSLQEKKALTNAGIQV